MISAPLVNPGSVALELAVCRPKLANGIPTTKYIPPTAAALRPLVFPEPDGVQTRKPV